MKIVVDRKIKSIPLRAKRYTRSGDPYMCLSLESAFTAHERKEIDILEVNFLLWCSQDLG